MNVIKSKTYAIDESTETSTCHLCLPRESDFALMKARYRGVVKTDEDNVEAGNGGSAKAKRNGVIGVRGSNGGLGSVRQSCPKRL